MSYYTVYAPISGKNWGQQTYCFCCNHGPHNPQWRLPIDIGRSSVAPLWFYGSTNIRSIKVSQTDAICVSRKEPATLGLTVNLYCRPSCCGYIGTVRYGHVKQSTLRQCNEYHGGPLFLGWMLNATDWLCGCGAPGCCSCGGGTHVHMEFGGGDAGREANNFLCDEPITEGATWIFRFNREMDCGPA